MYGVAAAHSHLGDAGDAEEPHEAEHAEHGVVHKPAARDGRQQELEGQLPAIEHQTEGVSGRGRAYGVSWGPSA